MPKSLTSRLLQLGVLIALLVCVPSFVSAADYRVLVVPSSSAPVYRQLVNGIQKHLPSSDTDQITFNEISLDELEANLETFSASNNYHLIVAVGQAASDVALGLTTKTPVIATLVPKQSFSTTLNNAQSSNQVSNKLGAVFIDTPTTHQLLLAKLLLGDNAKLSLISSQPESTNIRQTIEEAKKLGIGLEVHEVTSNDRLIRELVVALNGSDALLALPDAAIINRNTARNILLTTYRHKIPVVTFSAAYVKAGALAAVYSSADQIAKQTAEMIQQSLTSDSYKMEHAQYFSVSINENVAKALGIQTIKEDVAAKQLQNALEANKQ